MGLKINFKKMKHRDNSVDNFGNSGISWHGALVFYSVWVYFEPGVYEMRQETIFINKINALDNTQETACILSLIEDTLDCIKQIFPYITRVTLQSDNTISYKSSIVPFFIHILVISTGLFVYCCIHTYTGSGEIIFNGCFATIMKISRAEIDTGFNVCILPQMVCALNYNGGW